MKESFITINSEQTQKLGEILAKELKGGEIVCLSGELGSGKTTFAQGALRGLGAKKPYASPTFVVMKEYKIPKSYQSSAFPLRQTSCRNSSKPSFIKNIYHIDAYRVSAKDILDLGWEEVIAGKNNIVIVEWAERVKRVIPSNAVWVSFEHIDDNRRKLVLSSKLKIKSAKLKLKV